MTRREATLQNEVLKLTKKTMDMQKKLREAQGKLAKRREADRRVEQLEAAIRAHHERVMADRWDDGPLWAMVGIEVPAVDCV